MDVVVCVHNALDDVQRCLASLTAETDPARHRIIVVNDGSSEATGAWLRGFANDAGATLIENPEPLRYTRAANQGLRESTADYAVLLNSDTIVTPGWLDKLVRCAESDPAVGIAGPLSNAASYQSVPAVFDDTGDWALNPLPGGMTPGDMAALVERVSRCEYPRVPFVNGFCFAIKRGVIDTIGYLDEESFPNGYGEENDYCIRARQAGFALAIADDAFVYHAKSKSYEHDARRALSQTGADALARKHGARFMKKAYRSINQFRGLDALRARLREALRGASPTAC